jgi:uncharacterized protein (UPF0261 family)
MWFKSKKTYAVKFQGRAGIVYQEGDKQMSVDSELLAGSNYDIVIFTNTIRNWQPPYEQAVLSENDKLRIRDNIAEALKKLRIDWQ